MKNAAEEAHEAHHKDNDGNNLGLYHQFHCVETLLLSGEHVAVVRFRANQFTLRGLGHAAGV